MKEHATYLIKKTPLGDIIRIFVKEVTDTSFLLQYDNGNTHWIEKDVFKQTYKIIEELSKSKTKELLKG